MALQIAVSTMPNSCAMRRIDPFFLSSASEWLYSHKQLSGLNVGYPFQQTNSGATGETQCSNLERTFKAINRVFKKNQSNRPQLDNVKHLRHMFLHF